MAIAAVVAVITAEAQSFRKGSLLVGISEGSTMARYTTYDGFNHQLISDQIIKGDRDPLQIEYGISNKWGIALSFGNDIFKINPEHAYKISTSTLMKSKTSESTIEINYHCFISKKWDLALFYGIGCYRVELFDKDSRCLNNAQISYKKGGISRCGMKARYYFFKRLSVLGMLSFFSASAQSDSPMPNDILYNKIQTSVKGVTLEFGLSYRLLK